MKIFITLEPHGIFGSNFEHICILTLSSHEASSSIILAGRALLVKMIITLESGYAFGSNFEYFINLFFFLSFLFFVLFFLLIFYIHFFDYLFYCFFFYCFLILMKSNIVQLLECKTVMRLDRTSFWPVELFW